MSQTRQFVTDKKTESNIKALEFYDLNKSEAIRLAVAYAMANAKDFKAWLDKQREAGK